MLSTVKIKSIGRNLLLIFALSVFFSCQKDLSIEDGGAVVTPPDLSTKINSSVSGFVTDENDLAVKNAAVQFGSGTTTTDKYGYFEIKNVQVVKQAAVVTVSMPGYFKGIKTYTAKEGKAAFFRIKLIPKNIIGSINATTGGAIAQPNGFSVKLTAGSVVNASSNTPYTGTVTVSAYWINPTATDFANITPGDQRGINTAGSLKLLQTYGMAAVELTGSSGELLQIANGQKATLTIPIPASIAGNAPASIPLWYFDEAKGLWKQEGSAVKAGNIYSGEVAHFSFWDWSTPSSYVNFDCTIKDAAGNPMPFVTVKISVGNSPNGYNHRYGWTDANGYVSGPVPDNAQLFMEVFTSTALIPIVFCTPAYSQTFATTNSNISLGTITVTSNASLATITGTITDCNNNPVTNGYIVARINNTFYGRIYVNNANQFSFSYLFCNTTSLVIDVLAVDANTLQESNFNTFTITGGANNIGNIIACGNTAQEFFNYSVNSVNYSITDTVGEYASGNSIYLYARTINYTNTADVGFSSQNIGTNSIQNLAFFDCLPIQEQTSMLNPIAVNITEYGSVGQFISGNFSGILTGTAAPNNTYNVTCNFRIRRQ